jgi:hypothetical protein
MVLLRSTMRMGLRAINIALLRSEENDFCKSLYKAYRTFTWAILAAGVEADSRLHPFRLSATTLP